MVRWLKNIYHLLIGMISVLWFSHPGKRLIVIGVTGTDGKTTTTTLIYEILKRAGIRASMITSVHAVIAGQEYDTGFHVTTPNSWYVQKYLRQAVDHGDTHMVLEVTSHALDQHRVYGVPFTVGVITNVTKEHLDWHGTFAQYLRTKLQLLTESSINIVNRDEKPIMSGVNKSIHVHQMVTYGIRDGADITPKTFPFTTSLPGIYNQYNCLAAIACANALSIDPKSIRTAIGNFKGIKGRMEIMADKPYTVIVDFAHTPNALHQVLSTLRPLAKKRLIHVFGSAGLRDPHKRPAMGAESSQYADVSILTEEDYRTESVEDIMDQIRKGMGKKHEVHRFPNRMDAVRFALHTARAGDIVLLTGKGHEKSLCRGAIEYPWSDQDAVRKILGSQKTS